MANQTIQNGLIFDPLAFVRWVRRSLADLQTAGAEKCRPSHFSVDAEKPSTKNRVGRMLSNPGSIKLEQAGALEAEIRAEAERVGLKLPEYLVRRDAA